MGQVVACRHRSILEDVEDGVKTLICVHGLASCALEATTAEGYKHYACEGAEEEEKARLIYVSVAELIKRPHIIKTMALHHEPARWRGVRTVKTSNGYEGVDIQPVQGLRGIRSLNPGEGPPVPAPHGLWRNLIKEIGEEYNVAAFNYDWRRWGDLFYVEEVLEDFRLAVEEAYQMSGQKVVLVGHSMGAQVCSYCLGALGSWWTQSYVDDLVLVGGAAMGSPSMFAAYANGPSALAHSSAIPVAEFYETKLAEVTSTWGCMISEFPVPVGGVNCFDEDLVFAKTPSKSYCLKDVKEFLEDLSACEEPPEQVKRERANSTHEKVRTWLEEHNFVSTVEKWSPGYKTAARMYEGVASMARYMTAPSCRTHFIYSNNIQTVTGMTWKTDNLYDKAVLADFVPGDDTVTAASIEKLAAAWKEAGTEVCLHVCPGKVHHKNLIICDFTLNLLHRIMEGENVTENDDVEDGPKNGTVMC